MVERMHLFNVRVSKEERDALAKIGDAEGGVPASILIRRWIRQHAEAIGIEINKPARKEASR